MMTAHRTFGSAACLAAALIIVGCSSDTVVSEPVPAPPRATTSATPPPAAKTTDTPATTTTQVPVPPGLVGAGCADYVKKAPSGPGSLDGMGRDPVAVALGNSPLLTTFAGALMGNLNPEVNLFDAANAGQFTVFAPTDEAFGKLSPETVEKFKGDPKLLTGVLNYHFVQGQTAPEDIVGEHKTVQGQSLAVSGSGDGLRVNGAAVVCGGIRTANATVYLIDTVLTPPATASSSSSSSSASTTDSSDTSETTAAPTP